MGLSNIRHYIVGETHTIMEVYLYFVFFKYMYLRMTKYMLYETRLENV